MQFWPIILVGVNFYSKGTAIPISVTDIFIVDNLMTTVREPSLSETTEMEQSWTKPAVTKPTVNELTKPIVTGPTVTQPTVTEPKVTEPTETEPTVTEPSVTNTIEQGGPCEGQSGKLMVNPGDFDVRSWSGLTWMITVDHNCIIEIKFTLVDIEEEEWDEDCNVWFKVWDVYDILPIPYSGCVPVNEQATVTARTNKVDVTVGLMHPRNKLSILWSAKNKKEN
eukprot:GFUD01084199.1.p1 GENE.GFUD01084199.1~~GFUD01084199.1.p1  ORF type:complete len:224 (+),score=46.68 GFUD01084199.1:80-751(+)